MVAMADVCVNSGECVTEQNSHHNHGKVGKKQHPTRVACKARGWDGKLTSGLGEVGTRKRKLHSNAPRVNSRPGVLFFTTYSTLAEGRQWERTRRSSSRRAARASPCNNVFLHSHAHSKLHETRQDTRIKDRAPAYSNGNNYTFRKVNNWLCNPFL